MWKKISFKLSTIIAPFAFFCAIISVGTASQAGIYQPKVPKSLRK